MNNPSGEWWKVRGGHRVRLSEMTDSHLRASIEFFRSKHQTLLREQARRGIRGDQMALRRAARRLDRVDRAAVDRFSALDLPKDEVDGS